MQPGNSIMDPSSFMPAKHHFAIVYLECLLIQVGRLLDNEHPVIVPPDAYRKWPLHRAELQNCRSDPARDFLRKPDKRGHWQLVEYFDALTRDLDALFNGRDPDQMVSRERINYGGQLIREVSCRDDWGIRY